jgi:hypothetical protein
VSGRKALHLCISRADRFKLQRIARSLSLPWFQVRRLEQFWLWLLARELRLWLDAGRTRYRLAIYRRYERLGVCGLPARPTRRGRPSRISPLYRAQIIHLACLDLWPRVAQWSSSDLARQAVEDGILAAIGPRSVRRILQEVALQPQPHRTSTPCQQGGVCVSYL